MSKAITFFRNRQQGTGQTYELEIQDSARAYQIYIYARKPLDEALVRTRQLRGGSAKDEVDKIMQALQRGEGGVIASTYEQNSQRSLWIIPVVSGGKAAFGSFGLLRPGHPSLHLEPLNEKSLYFPPGSHALIPIDKEAEEYLRGFQEYIGYLPPDLESLVLHAIRDPSLDTRMGRLEATVFEGRGKPAAAQSRRSGVAQPWFKKLLKPVPVWPAAAAVLGLMLVVNSILLNSVLQSVNGSVVLPFRAAAQPPTTVEGGTAEVATPEQKIFAVVEAVRGKSSDSRFANLARFHFSNVQKENIQSLLARPSREAQLLVRGLLKLEALRLDAARVPRDFFDAADNWSQINTFYQGRSLGEKDREMLAALVCAAFGSPVLPQTSSEAAVSFADVDQTCPSFPLASATPGIDELLTLVQEAD